MNSASHSLKYQRFTTSGWKDIEIRNLSLWQRFNSFDSIFSRFFKDELSFSKNSDFLNPISLQSVFLDLFDEII